MPIQLTVLVYAALLAASAHSHMLLDLQLVHFANPANTTYLDEPCASPACRVGLLLCLVDLPFRNPQNCSLGDFATPVLTTSSQVHFDPANASYKFALTRLPAAGIGMMVEVRDYLNATAWQPVDFYTSALADVPLGASLPTTKVFSSLFSHNSSLTVTVQLYCAADYYGANCQGLCRPGPNHVCEKGTGKYVCSEGYTGEFCQTRKWFIALS